MDDEPSDSPAACSQFPPRLRWSGQTDRGKVRANNEDSFLALTFDAEEVRYLGKVGEATFERADFLFAVSDGMGGARSGEFASRLAVEQITRLLPRSFRLGAAGIATGFADVLSEVFTRTHAALLHLGQSYDECRGMGATLTVAWMVPGWVYFGHVGDSRLYHLPVSGPLRQLTPDDTHVGWLRRTGRINEREARTHPRRNVLARALGAGGQFVEPHVGAVNCVAGDRILLCTDGLIDGLWDRALEEMLREPALPPGPEHPAGASIAARLVDAAVGESGRDNTTAVVVEVV